jgi:protein ImuB
VSLRRIVAIHLPCFLSEIVAGKQTQQNPERARKNKPQGVVLVETERQSSSEVRTTDVLNAVCLRAHRAGVRAGQTINEARALVAEFQVEILERSEVERHLIAVAEVVQKYGITVSWQFPDTVWVDTTGVAHLYGGEEPLTCEIAEQIQLLGHVARICLAAGPVISQAIAKYGDMPRTVIEREKTTAALGRLPLLALPLSQERITFLNKLGLLTVEQLQKLPPEVTSSRLGEHALDVLSLLCGVDQTPLLPGEFPRSLVEEINWEDPAYGLEPILFALRSLLSKVEARLSGRGEACSRMELHLQHDPAIARHRNVLSHTSVELDLSAPLFRESDLERVLRSRLSGLTLKAPTIGLRLTVDQLGPALMNQMGLAEATPFGAFSQGGISLSNKPPSKEDFAILLAELEADVGAEGLGTLGLRYHLRPEARSVLQPIEKVHKPHSKAQEKRREASLYQKKSLKRPPKKASLSRTASQQKADKEAALYLSHPLLSRMTRLIKRPRPLHIPLTVGASFGLGSEFYTIENLRFIQRLEGVDWWTPESTSRDYFWAWLKSPRGGSEALLFFDRNTKESYLQAWAD